MILVEYSDSEEEGDIPLPPAKRRKASSLDEQGLPPLPPAFLDQYSSTVRTSTRDDPSLHGGRQRVTPHVEGNWPTHVYGEWYPISTEHNLLSEIVSASQSPLATNRKGSKQSCKVTSLLENDLNVAQPLHISLSRPLTLKTAQKDVLFTRLKDGVLESGVKAFDVQVRDLAWHPNESKTRWFLVLRLQTSTDLSMLLSTCNSIAGQFGQPLLYSQHGDEEQNHTGDQFHISIAWSLEAPTSQDGHDAQLFGDKGELRQTGISYVLLSQLSSLSIRFSEVKVRIGQDVHSIALKARRQSSG